MLKTYQKKNNHNDSVVFQFFQDNLTNLLGKIISKNLEDLKRIEKLLWIKKLKNRYFETENPIPRTFLMI